MKIAQDQLVQLNRTFKRIFTLPISRLTIFELQNAINQDLNVSPECKSALYESLLTGEIKDSLKKANHGPELPNLINEFALNFKMAREVTERGEFMNIFSCDFIQQGEQVYFVNRMRRIDGTEYHFLSVPEINIRLAHMFINRLRDLKKAAGNVSLDPILKEELSSLRKDVKELLD